MADECCLRMPAFALLGLKKERWDRFHMEDLSLHVLDIAENSIAAGAQHVEIRVRESQQDDLLSIEIIDDGRGMSEDMLPKVTDPFFTTRTTRRVGLGLPLFEQAAKRAGGKFEVASIPGAGTKVTGVFQYSHVDRQPLGDMNETLLALAVGNPQIEFSYLYRSDDSQVAFSTKEIKAQLGDIPISSPQGISAVRKSLERVKEQARTSVSREASAYAVGNG
jgi:anti-sigma regulatory factor (Ser/Thr protein kinase)